MPKFAITYLCDDGSKHIVYASGKRERDAMDVVIKASERGKTPGCTEFKFLDVKEVGELEHGTKPGATGIF